MDSSNEFWFKFWGVRGSFPCPGLQFSKFGGHTSCVEVRCGEHTLILDAGTGSYPLGLEMSKRSRPQTADILLSHTHLDHVLGLPFFPPFYQTGHHFHLWAGNLLPRHQLKDVIGKLMSKPLFPIGPDAFKAQLDLHDFKAGETFWLGPESDIEVITTDLNHPNEATGYRINYQGKSLCYITDTEHMEGQLNPQILQLIEGSDYVIYDSTYTPEEYPQHKNWGHSTWEAGAELCKASDAKNLVIFHHDPGHDDMFMEQLEKKAQSVYPSCLVAKQNLKIEL